MFFLFFFCLFWENGQRYQLSVADYKITFCSSSHNPSRAVFQLLCSVLLYLIY